MYLQQWQADQQNQSIAKIAGNMLSKGWIICIGVGQSSLYILLLLLLLLFHIYFNCAYA
jgi:hypothetical protein